MSNFLQKPLIDPAKSPIFYGYIILVIGTIGIYCSIPGQTIGVSVFTDPVKDALGLSRNQFSNAYMIGTIASSLVIGRAGVWFDTYGARYVAFFAALTRGNLVLMFLVGTYELVYKRAFSGRYLDRSFYSNDGFVFSNALFWSGSFDHGL